MIKFFRAFLYCSLLLAATGTCVQAQKLTVPEGTHEATRLIFAGQPERAMEMARKIQQGHADHPVGYLIEADALWWKFYCEACEIKWNTLDAWKRGRLPADEDYFRLTGTAVQIAEAAIRKQDTAAMRVYAGMGWALRARIHGLRDERMATARTGVKAREHFLRAAELDPKLGDAFTGIGLYNYYADALSPFVKFLRFFLGIPGGSKAQGMKQLEVAMRDAELTRYEARFYAAKCLRNYDRDYEAAVATLRPLVEEFPQNPVFRMILGDFYAKLSRNALARAEYEAAVNIVANADSACAKRIRQLAQQAIGALR